MGGADIVGTEIRRQFFRRKEAQVKQLIKLEPSLPTYVRHGARKELE